MKILVVATKSPWPPCDGGRLALWLTLQWLKAGNHDVTLIAPINAATAQSNDAAHTELQRVCSPQLVPVRQRSWFSAAVFALLHGYSLTSARHRHPAVARAVHAYLKSAQPDVVHVEQLQALSNCDAAMTAGAPVILRMQNVESSLWRQMAAASFSTRLLLIESARLRREERRAMHNVATVIALTALDAEHLGSIASPVDAMKLTAIAPPFPATLDAANPVAGAPALILSGSGGWRPNSDAQRWFLDRVWPLVLAASPESRLHVYGGVAFDMPGVSWHPAPREAIDAFPASAIAVIPLHIGSGVRMRILEAWSRGLPVVASRTAAAGLQVQSGRELLIAETPAEFVAAISRLHREPALRTTLVAAGHAYLAAHHDGATQTRLLLARYASVQQRH